MAATLGSYNPQIYANVALPHLYNALGFAGRVHRGIDNERNTAQKGDTINIRRPGTFSVQDAPATAEDLVTENVQVTLDQWREVKYKITDKELTFSDDRIIEEHIIPAMMALADDIDVKGQVLYKDVGRKATNFTTSSSAAVNYTNVRKAMRDAKIPLGNDRVLSYMIDPTMEQHYLSDSGFTQFQGAGLEGASAQRSGTLGVKYGLETFVTHNTQAHTGGTGADLAGAVAGAHAKNVSTLAVDGLTNTETFLAGDTFSIAGDSTKYAITADVTVASTAVSLSIEPPLRVAAADNAVVTFDATEDFTSQGMAFHRNAFALAMAPLSTAGNKFGARIGFAQDPETGLALRSRMFYDGDTSTVYAAFDVLFGWKTLDGRFAVRHGR